MSSISPLRAKALRLVLSVVPADIGDPVFADVAKDYGGLGTTCGYLPGWLLYQLGKRQGVNRAEPDTAYRIGANISAVRGNPAFVVYSPGRAPKPGDIYFTSNGPPNTEHVGVILEWDAATGRVRTADYGQSGPKGQAGRIVDRVWDPRNGTLTRVGTGTVRKLVGWIDIDAAR